MVEATAITVPQSNTASRRNLGRWKGSGPSLQLAFQESPPFLFAFTEPATPTIAALIAEGLRQWLSDPQRGFSALPTEQHLATTAVILGAASDPRVAIDPSSAPTYWETDIVRRLVLAGADPLGAAFCVVRDRTVRRSLGATYTPMPIVKAMTTWGERYGSPARVVDVGAGSGRFLLAAGKAFHTASLVGIEVDPLAALLARANLAMAGFTERSQVLVDDYRRIQLPRIAGPTMFIGNPPYVRHHLIDPAWKEWLTREANQLGFQASQLAGLHVHFFLSTLLNAQTGDYGVFVTAGEWLDVNYGRLVRDLLLRSLHAQTITVIDPTARPFRDAATTAVITTFEVGNPPAHVKFRKVANLAELGTLDTGHPILRERLATEQRWSHLTAPQRTAPAEYVELGELCRVHRGAVTGKNDVWIAGPHSEGLPAAVLEPTVTRAKEVIDAAGVLADAMLLRRVINLPANLDCFDGPERRAVDRFLRFARSRGTHDGYVARNRKVWWAINLHDPAPIISTYMARRPPAFALNRAEARLLNIAHGLYPREPLSALALRTLREYLSNSVRLSEGRTYAGGLVKFEPRELERVMVPGPEMLAAGVVTLG